MCEARVVIRREGKEQEVMNNVVAIRNKGEELIVVDLFGSKKIIHADIKEVRLIEHKIILEER